MITERQMRDIKWTIAGGLIGGLCGLLIVRTVRLMASAFEFPPLDRFFDNTLLDPVVAQRELAAFARRERDALISSGQASPSYETYVNERQGAVEETVIMPGPITYIFSNWKLVIETALAELQKRAPRRGGKYAASFLVTVGGRVVTDYMSIAPDATVIIINAQPYTRKMEVGANKTGARHFELSEIGHQSAIRPCLLGDVHIHERGVRHRPARSVHPQARQRPPQGF
jgi:hypothetical protein